MINSRKLAGGGDTAVEQMVETAALIGTDLIELLWTPRNRQPRHAVARVIGFKEPITDGVVDIDEETAKTGWVDGTIYFYPDANGNCWGYVYDSTENREHLARSLSNGWFRVVNKKIRDEIIGLANEMGLPTEVASVTEVMVKKSKREVEAEEKIKNTEAKLDDYKQRIAKLEAALSDAQGKKEFYQERKLKGVKIPKKKDENED